MRDRTDKDFATDPNKEMHCFFMNPVKLSYFLIASLTLIYALQTLKEVNNTNFPTLNQMRNRIENWQI